MIPKIIGVGGLPGVRNEGFAPGGGIQLISRLIAAPVVCDRVWDGPGWAAVIVFHAGHTGNTLPSPKRQRGMVFTGRWRFRIGS